MRTCVGYAGGSTPSPTYRSIGDHSESVRVEFDPARITYEELLAVAWSSHDACAAPHARQYAHIVFVHDDAQKRAALASRDRIAEERGRLVQTEIVAAGAFHRAEDYHQKYYLRRSRPLAAAVRALFPDERAFVDSTAAARINGYAGSHLTLAELRAELRALGIVALGDEKLTGVERDASRPREEDEPPREAEPRPQPKGKQRREEGGR